MSRTASPIEKPIRPSLRDVARRAGVSVMTASRSLGSRPRVSADTRARVLKIATELGYRPDPHVAKLMHHLRARRKLVFQGSICALTNRPPGMERNYVEAILRGATQRAGVLGYALKLIHLDATPRAPERLGRMLRNQGIEGVLLLPMAERIDLGDLLAWPEFAVIAATSSVTAPEVHRVIPHHYANTLQLCRQLAGRGYRRIGLVIDEMHDERVNHIFAAAVMWHNREVVPTVPPLFYTGTQPEGFDAWLRAHRPDAIVTTADHKCAMISRLLGAKRERQIGLASTNVTPAARWAGIDELPAEIGATAADSLASMIQRGVKGMPSHPIATMIEGLWRVGRSCPRRRN